MACGGVLLDAACQVWVACVYITAKQNKKINLKGIRTPSMPVV